jgi:hypothetical protein
MINTMKNVTMLILIMTPVKMFAEDTDRVFSNDPMMNTLQKAFTDLEQAWTNGNVDVFTNYIDANSRVIMTLSPNGPNGMYNSSHVVALLREKFKECDKKMFKFMKYKNIGDVNLSPYGVGRCQCLDYRSPEPSEEIVYMSFRFVGQHPVIESIKTQALSSTQPAMKSRN